jgi:hypothetical protein
MNHQGQFPVERDSIVQSCARELAGRCRRAIDRAEKAHQHLPASINSFQGTARPFKFAGQRALADSWPRMVTVYIVLGVLV